MSRYKFIGWTCRSCLFTLFFFTEFVVASGQLKSSFYLTPVKYVINTNEIEESIHSAHTRMECAISYTEKDYCVTFRFYEASGRCVVTNTAITGPAGDVYGKEKYFNAVVPGYEIYKRMGLELNLKISNDEVKQSTAVSECGKGGAQLLLVGDNATFSFIRDILRKRPARNYWISGRRNAIPGNFTSSNGKSLQFFNWAPAGANEPAPSCLALRQKHDYRFGDRSCTELNYYLCEAGL